MDQIFNDLRPVFYVLLLIVVFNSIGLFFTKRNSGVLLIFNSIFISVSSLVLWFVQGSITDQLNASGDATSAYLTIAMFVVLILGVIAYLIKDKRSAS